jgi:hypothetical protein
VKRRGLLLAVPLLAGCQLFGEPPPPPGTCNRDQDCPYPQKCYVDGCGSLPDDLLAEVVTSNPTASASVDLVVGPAHANVPLVLPDDQLLDLTVRRGSNGYPGTVQLLVSGQSSLLPGVNRAVQIGGLSSSSGQFKVSISTGRYALVVSPLDVTVPPATVTGLEIDAGTTSLTMGLLPAAQVQTLSGSVLAGPGQPETVPPQVQLLAPDGRSLSALRTADPSGAFQLSVGLDALDGGAILQTSPGGAPLGATVAFPVTDGSRFGQPFLIGDTAAPIRVSGTVSGPDGNPIPGASVFVQGTVQGGGSGNVGPAFSASDGVFALQTRPEAGAGSLKLLVIPPPGALGGLLRTPLAAPPGAPVSGTWSSPPRPLLTGSLLLPDAGPAAGVELRADPVAASGPGSPVPPAGASGTSGEAGTFALRLDPGLYVLEVAPGAGLPSVRTFVRVTASGAQVAPITLRPGRRLTALVLRDAGTLVPQALVRIYRVLTLDDGTQRALSLGEGISDSTGVATILLPQQ